MKLRALFPDTMACRIKFFRSKEQVLETQRFFNARGIKCFTRERSPGNVGRGEEPFGFDLFILRDEDVDEAKELLNYEYGSEWGDTVS
jgi:hypothetical protein